MTPLMLWLLTGPLLLAEAPVFHLDHDFIQEPLVPTPPGLADGWGVVDLPGLVVVRAPAAAFQDGFDSTGFAAAIMAAANDRQTRYDIALVVHSSALPDQFDNAAAFHRAFNNADVTGTGQDPIITPEVPIRSGLWFNHVDYWDIWPEGTEGWVFCHEVGHQWLAFARYDADGVVSQELLGRQRAHWSYFVDTPNSPMEGNAWIDNEDGTFTTDLDHEPVFSPLDLYMMGLLPSEDVPPTFYIANAQESRGRESSPEHLFGDAPVTVSGTRVEVPIDAIIAANGARQGPAEAVPTDIQSLYVLVVGPQEILEPATVDRALSRVDAWARSWSTCTAGRSEIFVGVVDEGRQPPPPEAPALIPRGAW